MHTHRPLSKPATVALLVAPIPVAVAVVLMRRNASSQHEQTAAPLPPANDQDVLTFEESVHASVRAHGFTPCLTTRRSE